ncbi:hypothetical protein [Pararhodobacter sp.]|uniref:hypothetical protein n=1 Tax=Pararhodobacter sp. TaxID=2127056 RepID=UPI002FDCC2ED
MQTGNFLYAPRWVKLTALMVLSLALVTALAVVIYYMDRGGRDSWVLVAISLAQIAASGLVIALIVFFSQRDANLTVLRARIREFLLHSLPRGLLILDCAPPQEASWQPGRGWRKKAWRSSYPESNVSIRLRYTSCGVECLYFVKAQGRTLVLRAQVNMGEVVFTLYLPAATEAAMEERRQQLDWGLSRLTGVSGYRQDWYFAVESFDNRSHAVVFLTRDFGTDFLDDNRLMLFVVNDLALNLRGLLKDCIERGIPTSYEDEAPRPALSKAG